MVKHVVGFFVVFGCFLLRLWLLWVAVSEQSHVWKEHLPYRYPRDIQCFFSISLLFFLDKRTSYTQAYASVIIDTVLKHTFLLCILFSLSLSLCVP